MSRKKNGFIDFLGEYGISLILFVGVGLFALIGLRQAQEGQQVEALRIAKESILRAAVSCYALEGNYPASYAYLKEHYGVRVDEEKYNIFYDIFASNMMPDVTVTEK